MEKIKIIQNSVVVAFTKQPKYCIMSPIIEKQLH